MAGISNRLDALGRAVAKRERQAPPRVSEMVTLEATPELLEAIAEAEAATGLPFDEIPWGALPGDLAGRLATAMVTAPWMTEATQ
jgi:hypothetical protein